LLLVAQNEMRGDAKERKLVLHQLERAAIGIAQNDDALAAMI
jgi:hypothetical protein